MSKTLWPRVVGRTNDSRKQTIYASAGAGTGKTQALVERIANLITLGGIKPENIAAMTFTVSAASELRQRIREELENRLHRSVQNSDYPERNILSQSIKSLDSAFIGTIHSFAQRLLIEHPINVGLPPVFELNDSVQSELMFDREWEEWLDTELIKQDFSDAIINVQRWGLRDPLNKIKDLALDFHENFHIVSRLPNLTNDQEIIKYDEELKSFRLHLSNAVSLRTKCQADDDRMYRHLEETVKPFLKRIDNAIDNSNEEEKQFLFADLPKFKQTRFGTTDNWISTNGKNILQDVKRLLETADNYAKSVRKRIGHQMLLPLIEGVSRMVIDYSKKRRLTGSLEFQDLLVCAHELLSKNEDVLLEFQNRYTHLLIDEFQDTDPLQLDLARLLTDRYQKGAPVPGSLFVVGDPKQSIYRFRGADLSQLQNLINSLKPVTLSLSENYRSAPEIIYWINSVFSSLMNEFGKESKKKNQADYTPLKPGKSQYQDSDHNRVIILGDKSANSIDKIRKCEANDVAILAKDIGLGNWTLKDENGLDRKSQFKDLCVLVKTRTGLPMLESAFGAYNIPYIVEGQTSFFESQIIRDLTSNLIAIDDPTDQVAIIASLKSQIWGCSDQDLYDWSVNKKKFEYASEQHSPEEFEIGSGLRKVAEALHTLNKFHRIRYEYSTPYLIEFFVRFCQIRELIELTNPSRKRSELVDQFIEIARKLQDSGVGSLRELVRWIDRHAETNVRNIEGAVSNNELNGVRIMTIHAAKGLEFPIVAVCSLQVPGRPVSSVVKMEGPNPLMAVKLGKLDLDIATSNYLEILPQEKNDELAENVRLAYVAATRAKEHLIVSFYRSESKKSKPGLLDHLSEYNELAIDSCGKRIGARFSEIIKSAKISKLKITENHIDTKISLELRKKWIADTKKAFRSASVKDHSFPSSLVSHDSFNSVKPDENISETSWNIARKGRGRTELGKAVHSVLQDVRFSNRSNINSLVEKAIADYSITRNSHLVAEYSQKILRSDVLKNATDENSWKEVWVAAEVIPGFTLEGYIDLLIGYDDGNFVLVDYKTDNIKPTTIDRRVKDYEPQLAGYALILEKLGMTVSKAFIVFANSGNNESALDYEIKNLDLAKQNVIELLEKING